MNPDFALEEEVVTQAIVVKTNMPNNPGMNQPQADPPVVEK